MMKGLISKDNINIPGDGQYNVNEQIKEGPENFII